MPDVTDYEVPQLIRIYKQKKKGDIITSAMYEAIDACVVSHVDEGNTQDDAIRLCMIEVRKQASKQTAKEMNKYKGSFRSLVNLTKIAADNGGELPKEFQVLPCGEFMTVPYGPMNFDSGLFQQMIGNFNAKLRAGDTLPVDTDHDGGAANGWITALEDRQMEGMWAMVDWNSVGKQRLSDKQYKFISPEWTFDYVDPLNSTHHGPALIAGSLTNRPLFNNMKPLVANETGGLTKENQLVILITDMNKAELIKKGSADPKSLSKEERKFLRANMSGETAETIVKLELNTIRADETAEEIKAEQNGEPVAPVVEPTEAEKEAAALAEKQKEEAAAAAETPEQKADRETAEAKLKADQETAAKVEADAKAKEEEAAKTAKESGGLMLTADEAKAYNENKMTVRQIATEKEVQEFIANEKGGKVYPKSKDALVSLVMTCSETQKTALFAFLKQLPELKIAGEVGQSNGTPLTAAQEVDKLTIEVMKADEKLTKAEAIKKVFEAHTDLANKYNQELLEGAKE